MKDTFMNALSASIAAIARGSDDPDVKEYTSPENPQQMHTVVVLVMNLTRSRQRTCDPSSKPHSDRLPWLQALKRN